MPRGRGAPGYGFPGAPYGFRWGAALDSRVSEAHTVPMGAIAVRVGLHQRVDRKHVVRQTDEQLIEQVRVDDSAAFEVIYDRYARGLFAFCAHMLGSRDEAEDALQAIFVSAYRALRSSDAEISLRPWLYTIARNRCLSQMRGRREEVGADEARLDRGLFDCLAEEVQRREDLRELLEDIHRLPPDQRAALVLFEMGDHSHAMPSIELKRS